MALVYSSGFDLFGNITDAAMDGWGQSGGGGGAIVDIQTTLGRSGGGALRVQRGSGTGNNPVSGRLQLTNQGSSQAHMYIGVAYNCNSNATGNMIIALVDNGTTQVDLRHGTDGSMTATRNGTTLGTIGAGTLTYSTYHYFEFDVVIHGTLGIFKVTMDGTVLLNLAGQNTQASANGFWNQMLFGGTAGQSILSDFRYDDLYVCDTTTIYQNAPLGDVRIVGQLPNGIGTYSQLTKVGASANNFQVVDDIPTNGDTDYVSSSVPGTQDTYLYPSLPANANTVVAVVSRPNGRRDDAGTRTLEAHIRDTVSGNEADSVANVPLALSYTYYSLPFPFNPITGLPWTVTDVNTLELGPKVFS